MRGAIQIAPAVRVSAGEPFGLPPGDYEKVLIGSLKASGFSKVYDTSFGADVVSSLEALEFLEKGGPVFNSCCTGWRLMAKGLGVKVCDLLSPQESLCVVADLLGERLDVSLMPCTLKHRELFVKEVYTVKDLPKLVEWPGPKDELDSLGGFPSGGGVGFGASGGVFLSVMQNLAVLKEAKMEILSRSGKNPEVVEVRIGGEKITGVLAKGGKAIREALEIEADFYEMMACPEGCVGGAGQPPGSPAQRARVLREIASRKKYSCALANPVFHRFFEEKILPHREKFTRSYYEGDTFPRARV